MDLLASEKRLYSSIYFFHICLELLSSVLIHSYFIG